jgi:hypothetical protein
VAVEYNNFTGNPFMRNFLPNITITTDRQEFFVDNNTAFQTIMDFLFYMLGYQDKEELGFGDPIEWPY